MLSCVHPLPREEKAQSKNQPWPEKRSQSMGHLVPSKPRGGGWGCPSGGRQRPAPSAGRRTGSALAGTAPSGPSPFPSEKGIPKASVSGGRAMEDPPSSTKSKAKLTSIPSRLTSPHATHRAAFSVRMRPRWAHAPFSLHQGTGARGSG